MALLDSRHIQIYVCKGGESYERGYGLERLRYLEARRLLYCLYLK